MQIQIRPGRLTGQLTAPASKSAAHRAVICAALAAGNSTVHGTQATDDMVATVAASQALGAQVQLWENHVTVTGINASTGHQKVDCNESGSTLRFFVPIAAALGRECSFWGRGQLPNRPMEPLIAVLKSHGVSVSPGEQPGEILRIAGQLQPGRFAIAGDVSSQYITGLLFALPLLDQDSEIVLLSPLQSKGYVDMTLATMAQFGVVVDPTAQGWRIPGGQHYRACTQQVEGDYSGAAFWLGAAAIGSPIAIAGLDANSLQGDREMVDIVERFGAVVEWKDGIVAAAPNALKGLCLDVSQVPDLVPILAVVAAYAQGETRLINAARLRDKECDRLKAMTEGLGKLGAHIVELSDELVIQGGHPLTGGTVDSFADHRIAMALSIAATRCQQPVTITDAQCVAKSYPHFYQDFAALGGICHVL